MVLVFIFLGIISIMFLLVCAITISTVRIGIENFEASNTKLNKNSISDKYKLSFGLYLFNKIKWFSLSLNSKKIEKVYRKINIKNLDLKKLNIEFGVQDLKKIKELKAKISNLNLKVKIGTMDAILTSYFVALFAFIISIILSRTIKKQSKEKYYYKIEPLYLNKNMYEIKLDCIIEIKFVHIIDILNYFFKKRRGEKYGKRRTSNRRSYGYSYE